MAVFDSVGTLLQYTDTTKLNGRSFVGAYDRASKRVTSTTPEGRRALTDHDSLGRTTRDSVPGMASLRYAYDSRGRLQTLTNGTRSTQYTYGSNGRLASASNATLGSWAFTYDSAGRPLTSTLPGNRQVQFTYDANGNLASLTPPSRPAYQFGYNNVDRLTSIVMPDTVGADTVGFTYNLKRELTQLRLNSGRTITLAYDTAGRPKTTTSHRGTSTFAYHTTTGNLSSITGPDSSQIAYTYDGSLRTSATHAGAISGVVSVAYDSLFRPFRQWINGADTVSTAFDNDGMMIQAGRLSFTRDSTGAITASQIDSITTATAYSTFGELKQQTALYGSTLLFSDSIGRDAAGRIVKSTQIVQGDTLRLEIAYDSANRVSTVTRNGVTAATYAYDLNGNRTGVTRSSGTTNGTYDVADRMLTYGTASYSYDADGSLSRKVVGADTTDYAYDALGNLTSVTLQDGTLIEYLTDAYNRRVGKIVDGTVQKRWLYGGELDIIAELNGSGAVETRFVYGTRPNVPEYMVRSGTTYRIITDQLGSVRLVVNSTTGQVVQRIDYDEYGNITADSNAGFQPFGYAGGLLDSQVGLTRFGARDYDAVAGRWTAQDPIGFTGGSPNLYEYVGNDPVNAIDPTGKFIDLGLDLAFIGYDIAKLIENLLKGCSVGGDLAALGADIGGAFIPGITGLGGMVRHVDDVRIEWHHMLPQEFKEWFARAGAELDIEDFRVELPVELHRLSPDGIHTKAGGDWNGEWSRFIKDNPEANRAQILKQLNKMERDFSVR
ncbi:MAG: RHS repeat-associated core domain-containing protein [Gemmatimonadota bacterium]